MIIKKILLLIVYFAIAFVVFTLIKTILNHLTKRKNESVFFLNKIDAVAQQTISENLITKGSTSVPQTWSIWVKLNSLKYNYGSKKTILSKTGISTPKLEISPKTNSLEVSVVNDNGGTNVIIPNKITINDWTHIAVVVTRKFMEVYINGKLLKTKPINGKVKTDLSDVIISENSGFAGSIKNLRYFNKQVSAADIYSIYQREKPRSYIPVISWLKQKMEPTQSEAIPKDKPEPKKSPTDPVCPPCENK